MDIHQPECGSYFCVLLFKTFKATKGNIFLYIQEPNTLDLSSELINCSIHPLAKLNFIAYLRKAVSIISFKCSASLIKLRDIIRLMLFQVSSIGFKSGGYVGKNTKLISSSLANSNVSCAVCCLELSAIPIFVLKCILH
jgi:hypothetical protein